MLSVFPPPSVYKNLPEGCISREPAPCWRLTFFSGIDTCCSRPTILPFVCVVVIARERSIQAHSRQTAAALQDASPSCRGPLPASVTLVSWMLSPSPPNLNTLSRSLPISAASTCRPVPSNITICGCAAFCDVPRFGPGARLASQFPTRAPVAPSSPTGSTLYGTTPIDRHHYTPSIRSNRKMPRPDSR